MAKPVTYAKALKQLSGQDRSLWELAEKLTNEGMTAAGVPGLFGLREFAVGQGRKALENLGGKLKGTNRRSRTEQIEAAHRLLLTVSFFEPLDDCLTSAGLRLRSADLEMTAEEQLLILERALRAEDAYAPAEDFLWDRYHLFDRAEAIFTSASEALLQLIGGLKAAERAGIDTGRGSKLVAALRDKLPRLASAAYRDHYLRLCAETPEFGMWAQLCEHEQTRDQVKNLGDAFDGLHESLSRISSRRPVGDLRVRLSRKYQALLRKPILPVDDVLPEDLPAGMVIPPLHDCYVPPNARVAKVTKGDTPSTKEWWEGRETLPDLQQFLAARLTHPDMTRYPTVILGEPGAGKSKLTEVLAAQLPEEDFLAVRVELRSVSADAAVHTQIEEGLERDLLDRVRWSDLLAEAKGALPVVVLDGFDELLQAAGVERHHYLEQIRDFQSHQEDMGQPVVVIVTSRTLSASRARFPERSTVILLEPFNEGQIDRVSRAWNQANWELFRSSGLRPLALERLLAYPELSRQPLLLLLLLVYDAQDNDLQRVPGSLSLGQLYERLLATFVHRQVRKHHGALSERDLRREVQGELRRLEATALAMSTRQRQSVGSRELDDDLAALELDGPQRRTETGSSLPIRDADLLLGRFFFVHVSQARLGGPDEAPLSAYEFLHATFGEYLVARMVARTLRTLVDARARNEEVGAWGEPPNDGFLYTTSSFGCYADRERTVDFLRELIGKDIGEDEDRRAHYSELLIELFRGAPYPSANRPHSAYRPRRLPLTSRQAYYTANLLVLLLVARGEGVDIRELFSSPDGEPSALQQWRTTASLWRTLPSADWFTVLGTLRLRHRSTWKVGDYAALLELDDRSDVNVGESMGFELHSAPSRGLPSVVDPYELTELHGTATGQLLRSVALRADNTAARLLISLLPALGSVSTNLGAWESDPWSMDSLDTLWSQVHEISLLRLRPGFEDPERRLAAYSRLLRYPTLARVQLLALQQASEDLEMAPRSGGYPDGLRRLLQKYLRDLTSGGTLFARSEEVRPILARLSLYVPNVVVEQAASGIRDLETQHPGGLAEFTGVRTPTSPLREEHSVIDVQTLLDAAFPDAWADLDRDIVTPPEPF